MTAATPEYETNLAIEEKYSRKREVWEEMKRLNAQPAGEWSAEDKEMFDKLDAEIIQVDVDIKELQERQHREHRMAELEERNDRQIAPDSSTVGEMRAYRENRLPGLSDDSMRLYGLCAWLSPDDATSEMLYAAKRNGLDINKKQVKVNVFNPSTAEYDQLPSVHGGYSSRMLKQAVEERQQATDPGSAGGFTVPQGMMQAIEVALLRVGRPRQYSNVVRTATGREVPWPTTNDTNQEGVIVAENAAVPQQDVVFGQATTKPFMYSSKKVPVSLQLMQDSATNMQALLGRLLGERIARVQARHFTSGTGSGEPRGITIDAPAGVTLTAAGTFTTTQMYDLKHSVDPDYREMGHGWLFADATLAAIKKLKVDDANDARPLWQAGLAAGEPNTIDGDPYYVNQAMPAGATLSAKIMCYGQLNKYIIHDGLQMVLRRLDEVGAENHQVIFLGFMRSDGRLLDAGTNPVKSMVNPAT